MIMRLIKSPIFPLACALIFGALAWIFPAEQDVLIGLAGTALFWAFIDLCGKIFGTGGVDAGEARFDTRNKEN
jgi:hypothetical protein